MNFQHWPSPKRLLQDQLLFAGFSTLGLFITVVAIIIGYHLRSDNAVNQSFWSEAVAGVAPWYALAIGIYLMAVVFPVYVLYGDTRKRFAQRIALFDVFFSIGLALMALAGMVIETIIYRAAGWNHAIAGKHLYRSDHDLLRFFLELFIIVLPWFACGALIGALSIGRQTWLIAAIPLCIIGVALVNIFLGLDDGPAGLANRLFNPGKNTLLGILVSLIVAAVAFWGIRIATHDMAIQNQKA